MWRAHPGEVGPLTADPGFGGTVDPAFAAVQSAFRDNFLIGDEIGAGLCVRVHGRTVVDLWGGLARADGTAWGPDTMVNSFSVGKGVLGIVTALCVDRGHLGWNDLVADHWPEFAAHDKGSVTLTDLLGHRAGLPAIRRLLPEGTMLDWGTMCAHLATEQPWWSPGSQHGYHVNTFGFLVGEVLRRATSRSVGMLLREFVAAPLGADVHYGLANSRHECVADLIWHTATVHPAPGENADEAEILQHRAYANPPGLSGIGWVNGPHWRSAEMPSTNMHASARGIARVFDGLCSGDLVSPGVLTDATEEISNDTDAVLGRRTRFARGFQLPLPERRFGPNDGAFGHYGAGGALGFCDPVAGVAFGYAMNRMGTGWQNERNSTLLAALYSCL